MVADIVLLVIITTQWLAIAHLYQKIDSVREDVLERVSRSMSVVFDTMKRTYKECKAMYKEEEKE